MDMSHLCLGINNAHCLAEPAQWIYHLDINELLQVEDIFSNDIYFRVQFCETLQSTPIIFHIRRLCLAGTCSCINDIANVPVQLKPCQFF